jgi:hypothetical protein
MLLTSDSPSDETLLRRVRAGDAGAFRTLVERYAGRHGTTGAEGGLG